MYFFGRGSDVIGSDTGGYYSICICFYVFSLDFNQIHILSNCVG